MAESAINTAQIKEFLEAMDITGTDFNDPEALKHAIDTATNTFIGFINTGNAAAIKSGEKESIPANGWTPELAPLLTAEIQVFRETRSFIALQVKSKLSDIKGNLKDLPIPNAIKENPDLLFKMTEESYINSLSNALNAQAETLLSAPIASTPEQTSNTPNDAPTPKATEPATPTNEGPAVPQKPEKPDLTEEQLLQGYTAIIRTALVTFDQSMKANPTIANALNYKGYNGDPNANTPLDDHDRNTLFQALANIKAQAGIGQNADGSYDATYTPEIGAELQAAIANTPALWTKFADSALPQNATEDQITALKNSATDNVNTLITSLSALKEKEALNGGVDPTLILASPVASFDMSDLSGIWSMIIEVITAIFPQMGEFLESIGSQFGLETSPTNTHSSGKIDFSKPLPEATIATFYDVFKNPDNVIQRITGLLPDGVSASMEEERDLMNDAIDTARAAAEALPSNATEAERQAAFGTSLQNSIDTIRNQAPAIEQQNPAEATPAAEQKSLNCKQFEQVAEIQTDGATTFAFTASGLALTEKELAIREECAQITGQEPPTPAAANDHSPDPTAEQPATEQSAAP